MNVFVFILFYFISNGLQYFVMPHILAHFIVNITIYTLNAIARSNLKSSNFDCKYNKKLLKYSYFYQV